MQAVSLPTLPCIHYAVQLEVTSAFWGLALGLILVKAMEQELQACGCLDGFLQDLPICGSSCLWSETYSHPLPSLAAQKLTFALSGIKTLTPL